VHRRRPGDRGDLRTALTAAIDLLGSAARRTLLFVIALSMAACASLPHDVVRQPSAAIAEDAQSPLSRMIRKVLPADGRSGFRLQPYGPNSFATRIELTALAARSIDVQYYLLKDDNTGLGLMRALRDAALRGVRVRVLIDDLYTTGEDDVLLALAATPNVQVRLFNPFPGGRASELTRFVSSGLDISRVNRRMHNKLFIADNAAAVAGGRNMADEYVMNAEGSNFVDMDVFAAGPVVRALSDEFDHYWNSEVAYPVDSIARSTLGAEGLQRNFERATLAANPPEAEEVPADGHIEHPSEGVPDVVGPELTLMLDLPFELRRRELSPLLWANARVLFDPLTKTQGRNERDDSIKGTVTEGVITWLSTARQDIKMVTPYFVPTAASVARLAEAHRDGLSVELVTNSLASTDEPWVYVGYRRHLKELLEGGIQVSELSPTFSVKRHKLGIFGKRTGALHMKNAVVDHREVFLGSMNLDPRSAKLNTELGLIIQSEDMARQLRDFADAGSVYHLRLGTDGERVEWVENADGLDTVYDSPPETTGWLRFKLWLLSPFIPEKEL
jgi:putative cardiolipin synthase